MADLSWLAGKLTSDSARVLEAAVAVSQQRDNNYVGVEHLVWGLTEMAPSEVRSVVGTGGFSVASLRELLEEQMQPQFARDWEEEVKLTPRASRALSSALDEAKRQGVEQISPRHLLAAVLLDRRSAPTRILEEHGISADEGLRRLRGASHDAGILTMPPALKDLCHDLTSLAEEGKLTPILGREEEIGDVLGALLIREGPANPILTGPAGVGKSAIVEGLAQRLTGKSDEVPSRLRDCRVFSLSMNALVGGTIFRGSLEAKLKQVIDFFVENRERAVLYIDEIHSMVRAGIVDALLAPLASGQLRLIGATTSAQYKQLIANNDALSRRLRRIEVSEPPRETILAILRSLQERYRQHYGLRISDEAVAKVLELAPRYVRSLKLPHKAKQWLVLAAGKAELEARGEVTEEDVVHVVSEQASIPEELTRGTPQRLDAMHDVLRQRVIGQDHVLSELQEWLVGKLGPVPQRNPTAPNGVFLFLGPTGTGKTETAKALAEFLFGDESRIIRLDMSEYQDNLAYIRLIGHARGVVGAEQGGLLTESIKDAPYSLVLLDEIEKAHETTLRLFLQILDEGWVTSGLGETVYFSDSTIIMTSNLGAEIYGASEEVRGKIGFKEPAPIEEGVQQACAMPSVQGNEPVPSIHKELSRGSEETRQEVVGHIEANGLLAPELLNRIDALLVFDPLSLDSAEAIVCLLARKLSERIAADGKEIVFEPAAAKLVAELGLSPKYNARELNRVFTTLVENKLSACYASGNRFHVAVDDGEILVQPLNISDSN